MFKKRNKKPLRSEIKSKRRYTRRNQLTTSQEILNAIDYVDNSELSVQVHAEELEYEQMHLHQSPNHVNELEGAQNRIQAQENVFSTNDNMQEEGLFDHEDAIGNSQNQYDVKVTPGFINAVDIISNGPEMPELSNVTFEFESEVPEGNNKDSQQIVLLIDNNGHQMDSPGNENASTSQKHIKGLSIVQRKRKGRSKDLMWSNFETKRNDNGEIVSNICKLCHKEIFARIDSMKTHYYVCFAKTTRDNKKIAAIANESGAVDYTSQSKKSKWDWDFSEAKRPQKLANFMDTLTKKQSDSLNLKLGRFIFSANIPFNILDNLEFKEFLKELRPSYMPPSRWILSNTILNEVYDDMNTIFATNVMGKRVTLQQDGWTTIQNKPVICHCVSDGKNTYFIDTTSSETDTKSAEYCLNLLQKTKENLEKNFNCQVTSVVTDNCSTMNLMRTLFLTKFPHLFAYGCNSHLFNLIGKKITPKEVTDQVVKVQKLFRNHHIPAAYLSKIRGVKPILPVATRWNSQIDCFQSYLENHTKYLTISRENCELPTNELAIIRNNNLFDRVKNIVSTLKPIQIAVDGLQKENATVADAVKYWLRVNSEVKLEGDELKYFNAKMNQGLPPVSLAAYCLHPKYRGILLSPKQIGEAHNWMAKKHNSFLIAALQLQQMNREYFPEYLLNDDTIKKLEPIVWWSAIDRLKKFPAPAIEVILSLMQLPPSTAGLERCFSTLNNIMTKNRNQIGIEKALKLCTIHRSLRNKQEVFSDEDEPDKSDSETECLL